MTHKKRLLVGPAVPDKATLESIIVRLAHYVGHLDVDNVVVAVTPALTAGDPLRYVFDPDLPSGVDADVLARVPAIASKTSLHVAKPGAAIPSTTADYLLFWDVRARAEEPWLSVARGYRQNRTSFDIDWQRTRTEGASFAELSRALSTPSRRFDGDESTRFSARTEHLLASPTAFLIATGPSARRALDTDMSEGVRIACNTTILDDELMEHVRPHIITFADPIFHFGPSTYAHQFHRALARLARRHDVTVVTIERFAGLLRNRHPQLADRIVGVRLGSASWPQNYDLMRDLAVRPYPNVLTMLMLPLAMTFSRSIELVGFDGREPKDTYFWRHGDTVQFDRELAEIKLVHPGFFDLDYEDYYEQHTVDVEQMFLDIEVRGGVVRSLSPSYMRPLRRRALPLAAPPGEPISGGRARRLAPLIVSITPDWTGQFGHFGPWERAVGGEARARGYEYRSLASRAVDPADDSVVPTFTHGTLQRESADAARFEDELRRGLEAIAGDMPALVCFYAADIWHLPSLLTLASERPTTTIVVNLMRAHDAITSACSDGRSNVAVRLLRECLSVASGTNVHVCLDTPAIVSDLERVTGHTVPTWPMVTVGDLQLLLGGTLRGDDVGGPLRIVAPVHAQHARGFRQLVELAERLSGLLLLGRLELSTRFAAQISGTTVTQTALAARFRDAGGRLVTEILTDAQYAALVRGADIVLLPYHRSVYRTRTSGVVLDAIAAGKPVVAVRGTWAGDVIECAGMGTTYEDGDVESLEVALTDLVQDLATFTARVIEQRDRLIARYLPARLIEFIAALGATSNPPPDPIKLRSLRTFAELASFSHWRDGVTRNEDLLRSCVQIDDVQRLRDDALDQIELLRRANLWRQAKIDRLTSEHPRPAETSRSLAGDDPGPGHHHRPPDELDRNVCEREAQAHLDELELVAHVIRPELLPDGVMIDVGAHTGSSFRRFRQAGWKIFAFEPDPQRGTYLAERFGDDAHVVLDNRAVSNVTGERMTFYVSEESTGISGLSPFRPSHVAIGDVETVALRDIAGLTSVEVLKVDTEGFEKFVLDGFPWERIEPTVVVAEFEDSKTRRLGYETRDLIALLRDRGYQVWVSEWHPIVHYGIRHQWRRLVDSAEESPGADAWGNLIAFRRPLTRELIGSALTSVLRTVSS